MRDYRPQGYLDYEDIFPRTSNYLMSKDCKKYSIDQDIISKRHKGYDSYSNVICSFEGSDLEDEDRKVLKILLGDIPTDDTVFYLKNIAYNSDGFGGKVEEIKLKLTFKSYNNNDYVFYDKDKKEHEYKKNDIENLIYITETWKFLRDALYNMDLKSYHLDDDAIDNKIWSSHTVWYHFLSSGTIGDKTVYFKEEDIEKLLLIQKSTVFNKGPFHTEEVEEMVDLTDD